MKKTLIALLILFGLCLTLWYLYLEPRIWYRVDSVQIYCNDEISSDSYVYSKDTPEKLVLLPSGIYLIEPTRNTVEVPNGQPITQFYKLAFTSRLVDGGVSLRSAKIDKPQPVIVSTEMTEFTDLKGVRIRIHFSSPS